MKLLHNILKGMSLTTALFIFQSCYGMPQGAYRDMFDVTVHVTDAAGAPVDGVNLLAKNPMLTNWTPICISDSEGNADVLIPYDPSDAFVDLRFESDKFAVKDTTITDMTSGRVVEVKLAKK